mmetsp:Transcript_5866/g.19386  ORF Transcript_5866/g.19386 Transcript_5866/m.19386 type:complete len:206 (-) Transcript_5866:110-727(-)
MIERIFDRQPPGFRVIGRRLRCHRPEPRRDDRRNTELVAHGIKVRGPSEVVRHDVEPDDTPVKTPPPQLPGLVSPRAARQLTPGQSLRVADIDAVDEFRRAVKPLKTRQKPYRLQVRDDEQGVRVRRGRVLAVDRRNASSFGPRSHNNQQKLAPRVQGRVLLEEQGVVALDWLAQAEIDLDVEAADVRLELQQRHARVQDSAKLA